MSKTDGGPTWGSMLSKNYNTWDIFNRPAGGNFRQQIAVWGAVGKMGVATSSIRIDINP